MTEQTRKSYRIHVIVIAAAIFLGAALYFAMAREAQTPTNDSIMETPDVAEELVDEESGVAPQYDIASAVNEQLPSLLKERVLGDVTAPIKITEYSSFTCPHCAHFHKETFDKFKENYIDTGKAYLVFSDFPLNAPALHASLTARCMPEIRYFDFIKMLYERQEEWAYDVGYMNFLKARAMEYGISKERFEACLNNEGLQKGILEAMREAQTRFGVSSTPSFVINDGKKINGALPYDAFVEAIESPVDEKPETQESP